MLTFIQRRRRRFPLQTISPWALLLNFHVRVGGGGEEKNKKCEKIVLKTIYFEQFKKSFKKINVAFPNLRLDQGRETETHREREKEVHD